MPLLSLRAGNRILLGFTVLLLIVFALLDAFAPDGRRLVKIRGIDTVNYFDVTHSLLFDHDFNLNNDLDRMPPDNRFWFRMQKSGLPGTPWGLGYPILSMPMLALGTAIDAVSGRQPDGYGPAAIYVYCLGPILMTGLGLIALFHFLYAAGPFFNVPGERLGVYCLATTFAVFLGTNVGYYAFAHISHAGTFLCVSLFLGQWWNVRSSTSAKKWFVLGLLGGLLSICRWQDILYLGGPGLFDLLSGMPWKNTRGWLVSRLSYVAAAVLIWLPQITEWKVIYGKYLTIPQGDGFISFPPAHVWEVLFSSRNGWLLWSPLIALGLAGLILGAFRHFRDVAPWLAVIALEVTVISCMPTWHGEDSFSSRYLLANTSLAGLGLLILISNVTRLPGRALCALVAGCCIFTSLFAIQFRMNLVATNETLTPSEIFSEKLAMLRVRKQRQAVTAAMEMLGKGDPAGAVRVLDSAEAMGENRFVLNALRRAAAATGDADKAKQAERNWERFLQTRWN